MPPSLVALPPRPRSSVRAPARSAASINSPVPRLLAAMGSRWPAVRGSPEACAISNAAAPFASSAQRARTGVPKRPGHDRDAFLAAAGRQKRVHRAFAAVRDRHAYALRLREMGERASCKSCAARAALREPLNESGAKMNFIRASFSHGAGLGGEYAGKIDRIRAFSPRGGGTGAHLRADGSPDGGFSPRGAGLRQCRSASATADALPRGTWGTAIGAFGERRLGCLGNGARLSTRGGGPGLVGAESVYRVRLFDREAGWTRAFCAKCPALLSARGEADQAVIGMAPPSPASLPARGGEHMSQPTLCSRRPASLPARGEGDEPAIF